MNARRAFTLVEVLIGVLVLALGLLGLGAIIPVVVREQRLAADATLGNAVLKHVRATLERRPEFSSGVVRVGAGAAQVTYLLEDDYLLDYGSTEGRTAWDSWLNDTNWSGPDTSANDALLWEQWANNAFAYGQFAYASPFVWKDTVLGPQEHQLTLADRLWPSKGSRVVQKLPPGADPGRPQFVWDIVGRRVAFGDQYARHFTPGSPQDVKFLGKPDVIQLAVFVRRIDMNIRMPRVAAGDDAVTLLDVFVNPNVTNQSRRHPVAVDAATDGLPTGNGEGWYAKPRTLPLDDGRLRSLLGSGIRDQLPVRSSNDAHRLLTQPGQKIVDNLGNVYSVLGELETDPSLLVISPPIPPSVTDAIGPGGIFPLRQIVFTPQPPVAIDIITITRPVTQ